MVEFTAAGTDPYGAALTRPRGKGYTPHVGFASDYAAANASAASVRVEGRGGPSQAAATLDRWASDRIRTSSALKDHASWLHGLRQSLRQGTTLGRTKHF
jgi:hypothetical protein